MDLFLLAVGIFLATLIIAGLGISVIFYFMMGVDDKKSQRQVSNRADKIFYVFYKMGNFLGRDL